MIEIGIYELLIAAVAIIITGCIVSRFNSKSSSAGYTSPTGSKILVKGAAPTGTDSINKLGLPMSIFYGSQSGTAETFANELSEEAKMYGFTPKVIDLEDYDRDELENEKYAVFLMATFGEGEPTDNSAEFIEWINSDDRIDGSLSTVPFAVFALGNRQYEHFCSVGRKLDERLTKLGAQRLVDHGEGDDDGSLEEDFNTWKLEFWTATHQRFGTKANDDELKSGETKKFESAFTLTMLSTAEEQKYQGGLNNLLTDPKHRIAKATVIESRELRQHTSDGSSTKHIEFDIKGLKISYQTADNLGVYPQNDPILVDTILKRLKYQPSQLFRCRSKAGKKSPFPSPCSIQDAFLWYLDFQASPRIPILAVLAQYTSNETDKIGLIKYAHELKDQYVSSHKSLLEVLEEFPSCLPPLVDLLDWCPKLAPRYYTISSSSLVHPTNIAITASLMIHHKPGNRISYGICSSYLCRLQSNKDTAAIFIRPSSFRFPKPRTMIGALITPAPADKEAMQQSNSTATAAAGTTDNGTNSSSIRRVSMTHPPQPPIIMVGPGTGIAPFRGFIHEVHHLRSKGIPVGEVSLFFGCRDRTKDYIYRDELESAATNSTLHQLELAFSRDPTIPKCYVQDKLELCSADIWNRIDSQRGYFYICGGTAMGRSVRECVIQMAKKYGSKTDKQAEDYVKKMQMEKRFVQELWS